MVTMGRTNEELDAAIAKYLDHSEIADALDDAGMGGMFSTEPRDHTTVIVGYIDNFSEGWTQVQVHAAYHELRNRGYRVRKITRGTMLTVRR